MDEIGLLELLAGLEGLVEDRARQQVAHLEAHQRLPAAGRRLRHLDVEAVVRRVLVFEEHLALDVDRFNQRCHCDLDRIILGLTAETWNRRATSDHGIRNERSRPFDEQAALEELERLQRAIRESRRQRGETVAEFDAFVRSFKDPAPGRDTGTRHSGPRREADLGRRCGSLARSPSRCAAPAAAAAERGAVSRRHPQPPRPSGRSRAGPPSRPRHARRGACGIAFVIAAGRSC